MSSKPNTTDSGTQTVDTHDENEQCSICYEPFNDKTTIFPCEHKTCYECIRHTMRAQMRVQKTCPFCRGKISELSHTAIVIEKIAPINSPMEMTRSQFPVEDLDLSGMGFEETAIVNVTNAVRAASRRQRIHQAEIEFEETITQLETRFAGLVESQTFLSSRLSQERDAIEDVFDDCLNIGVSINHFRTAEINRDEEGNFDEDFTFRSLFQRVRGLRQRSEERLDRLEDRIRDDAIEALVDVDSWDELPFRSED